MENENFVENIATPLEHNASVKTVYGEPIVADGKTIIPVAQVAFGFGGGFGQKARSSQQAAAGTDTEVPQGEKGAGGGGGMYARPKGVYEVSAQGTRFIPANNLKQLLLAGLVGFLVRGWLFGKRS
jgi:uncharacterized spore protein YtfJ